MENREVVITDINVKQLHEVLTKFMKNGYTHCGILVDKDSLFYIVPLLNEEEDDFGLGDALGLN